MNRNNVLLAGIICAALCAGCSNKEETQPVVIEPTQQVVKQTPVAKPVVKKVIPQKTNLFIKHEDRDIPLSAVVQISNLPQNIKNIVLQQIQNTDVYFLSVQKDKIIILKEFIDEDDRFTRHDFEIISVSIPDGKVKKETNFPQKMSNEDSETEVWKYDVLENEMVVPSSHTSLNEDGSIKTVENWYYGDDDDLRYKLTDSEGKTISLRKTTKSDNGTWRDEHIFYDKDGKTALNLSFVYENNHVSRFTFYNPQEPETGVIMVNEYEDIDKVKEMIYSSDYKLKNSYSSIYKDGERTAIKVFDNENNETAEFLAE